MPAGRTARSCRLWKGGPCGGTPYGHDTLAYDQSRPRAEPSPGEAGADRQLVELIPSRMATLRVFVGLTHQLRVPGSGRRAVADRHAARLRRRGDSRELRQGRLQQYALAAAVGMSRARTHTHRSRATQPARSALPNNTAVVVDSSKPRRVRPECLLVCCPIGARCGWWTASGLLRRFTGRAY
nr:DUF6417 family protein [Streptomyces mirabilis]